MVQNTTYNMKFRRRRQGKTDYRKRLALLKSKKNRLVARVKGNQVVVQIIEYDIQGDKVKESASSTELKKYGYKQHGGNARSAYLTGLLCGHRAVKNGNVEAVFDTGLHTPVKGSNVFAALKAAVDAGMRIPHSEEVFPVEERISGKMDAEYTKNDSLVKNVEETKNKIDKEFVKE